MARERRSGGRKGKSGRSTQGVTQLPWQQVKNSHSPMEMLNPDQLDQLHKTSFRILSEAGIRVLDLPMISLAVKHLIAASQMPVRHDCTECVSPPP